MQYVRYFYSKMYNHGNAALQPACNIFLKDSTRSCRSVWLMFSSLKNSVQ